MKSKNYQLVLLAAALTVSFGAQAAKVDNVVNNTAEAKRVENPLRENTDKRTDANIYGHVIDKKTGEHMPFVTIQLKGTTIATTTDKTGHYFLKNLPEGTHTIVVKFLGYQTVEKTVTVKHDATQEQNFSLEADDVSLDEVVVSANRNETARRLAPNLVNVIGPKLLDVTQSVCLAQGLNFQPGVRTEDNCQNCGFTQVRINGLDGHYSQILVNSRSVFSSLNGVYGLEQIPANMIDRVEVVRGGGSALFGASAIGGTINIITKEPIRNSATFGHTFMSIGGSNTFDNVSTGNVSLVTDDNKAGVYAYGQTRNRQGYDHDGDGYTELPALKNQTFGLSSYFRMSPYTKLSLQYHGIHEFRRGGNMLNLTPHLANITEQVEHDIQGGASPSIILPPTRKTASPLISPSRQQPARAITAALARERRKTAKRPRKLMAPPAISLMLRERSMYTISTICSSCPPTSPSVRNITTMA